MDIIKNLLRGMLEKIENAEQNADGSGTPQKNFIPYIGGAFAIIIVLFLFVGGGSNSPQDIAEKFAEIHIKALNEGRISEEDMKWLGNSVGNPIMRQQVLFGMRQTANLKRMVAQSGSSIAGSRLKEIKTIEENDYGCVVSIVVELTFLENGITSTEDSETKIYFKKTDSWKIQNIESH